MKNYRPITWVLALAAASFCTVRAQSVVTPNPSGPADEVKGVPYRINLPDDVSVLFSGYIQVRYTDAPNTSNPFQVKRLRFIADANVTDTIDFFIQIDPTLNPNVLLDGYVQWKPLTQARVRAGQFKVPFSGESLTSDERTIPIERSIVVNSFSPDRDNAQQGRDLGVQLLGNVGSSSGPSFEYAAAILNGSGIYNVQTNRQKAGSGRFIVHPIKGVSMGGDYYQGKEPLPGAPATSTFLVTKERQEAEAGYKLGHFVSWGEYIWGHDGAITRSGGYAFAGYKFTSHWESYARVQDFDANHVKKGSITRLYDAGVNYYIKPLVRLQGNYGVQKTPVNGRLAQVFLAQIQAEF